MAEFQDVFKGIGNISGTVYRMRLRPGAGGVINSPMSVALALRERVKSELKKMEDSGIIVQVTEPTAWVNNMVVVTRGDKISICMDPRDLNQVLMREHYPMPPLEDIATRLNGAKWFSTLDASTGFWQIKLDNRSSHLCTFATPFGRYRFTRMPFGISSAPEVFQRAMHHIFENI